MQKMARRHEQEGGNHLEQESNRQKTMEDVGGGLHPAVDGQSLGERWKVKTLSGRTCLITHFCGLCYVEETTVKVVYYDIFLPITTQFLVLQGPKK